MAYFDLTSNQGYMANYKVGLTGETGVVITPAVKSVIENTVDAYINGRLHRTFSGTTPPMIQEIAEKLTMWQIVGRVTPGRDPSNSDDREAARRWKEEADDILKDILYGDMDIYATDGSKTVVSTKDGKYVLHGEDDESHVFKMEERPENWGVREDVYDNG